MSIKADPVLSDQIHDGDLVWIDDGWWTITHIRWTDRQGGYFEVSAVDEGGKRKATSWVSGVPVLRLTGTEPDAEPRSVLRMKGSQSGVCPICGDAWGSGIPADSVERAALAIEPLLQYSRFGWDQDSESFAITFYSDREREQPTHKVTGLNDSGNQLGRERAIAARVIEALGLHERETQHE